MRLLHERSMGQADLDMITNPPMMHMVRIQGVIYKSIADSRIDGASVVFDKTCGRVQLCIEITRGRARYARKD